MEATNVKMQVEIWVNPKIFQRASELVYPSCTNAHVYRHFIQLAIHEFESNLNNRLSTMLAYDAKINGIPKSDLPKLTKHSSDEQVKFVNAANKRIEDELRLLIQGRAEEFVSRSKKL